MSTTQKHPYHLLDPSPWPLLSALSALLLCVGLLMFFAGDGENVWADASVLMIGFATVVLIAALWWRDVIREAESGLYHNEIVQLGLRYGMVLFIASEVMFFAAWFWAFFDVWFYHGGANSPELVMRTDPEVLGGVWPPAPLQGKLFDPWTIPFLNTVILVSSGATLTWAHHALRANHRKYLCSGLGITILLGLTFTALQIVEYGEASFGFDEGIYPSIFYMATGFHGVHVVIGTIFLTVCFFRALVGHFTSHHHIGFEAAAWYWHFVDVVWLFLFTFIYWWGSL
ncbi:MAG: cytochrome c oxidase subunit 3 [Alphaproteobacteria bacterium GM7ARS4]|nr:cytochrome c oxidase subunit 3 [Alphaproteobacteria bacterium GM7ARS4]